ncbi:DUF11 domain-containing protein [Candidatus Roizmanbacteria bacterium]|nr:DUF11 domain-containing protein [Candidatus Roizmanbacteria bacterium]
MKMLELLVLLVSSFMFHVSPVFAQYGQYGGPAPVQQLLIDKFVGKVTSSKGSVTQLDYVDNLSPSDPRFQAGQEVNFKLKVKNTSNVNLSNVTVKDFLPEFVEPVAGPGTFDANSRTISFNAGNFTPDEEKTYFLTVKVVSQEKLPSDKGLVCLLNKSQASSGDISDEDTAQFCVEKQVVGITPGVSQVPSAGPEFGALLLAGQFVALGAGLFLKKKYN